MSGSTIRLIAVISNITGACGSDSSSVPIKSGRSSGKVACSTMHFKDDCRGHCYDGRVVTAGRTTSKILLAAKLVAFSTAST